AAAATQVGEPRFLLRLALARIDDGKFEEAFNARTRVGVAEKAAPPFAPVVDAELFLAGGRPDDALAAVGTPAADDLRANLVAGRASLDLGKPAGPFFDAALKLAPTDPLVVAWAAAGRGDTAALVKAANAKDAPAILHEIAGETILRGGDAGGAQKQL